MAEITFSIEKISGSATAHVACGIWTKRMTLPDAGIGTIVSCVLVKSDNESDLKVVIGDLFEIATKKLEDSEGGKLAILKSVLAATGDYLGGRGLAVSFVHAFFWQEVCYFVKYGRDVVIWVMGADRAGEIDFESGSGEIHAGQIYLIASKKFLGIFDTAVLTGGDQNIAEIIDGLATEISAHVDQAQMGAVFVKVEEIAGREVDKIEDLTAESDGTAQVEETVSLASGKNEGGGMMAILPKLGRSLLGEFLKLRSGEVGARGRLRRNLLILIVILALILAGSGYWTFAQKWQREKAAEFNRLVGTAASQFSEGLAILELNQRKSREILGEAKKNVQAALAIDKDNERAKQLFVDIEKQLIQVQEVADLQLKVLVDIGQSVSLLTLVDGSLVAVGQESIFKIETGDPEARELAKVKGGVSAVGYDGKIYVLGHGKVYRVDLAGGEVEAIIESDGQDLGVFLGNVYLLKSAQISKFVPIVDGYSQASDYLSGSWQFSTEAKLAIDGLVWVADGDRVFKFLRGEVQAFEITGLAAQIGHIAALETKAEHDNLYLVDKDNEALLVVGKDGVFKRAYQANEFAEATDIAVADDGKTVYVALGTKVLMAGLGL